LPFCSNCGTEILAGTKFCPNCGAPQAPGGGSRQAPGPLPATRVKRPPVTTILTISHFILGLIFATLGALSLSLGLSLPLGLSAFYFSFGALVLVIGIASILAGYGFLRFRPWLKKLGVLTSIGYLVGGILLILSVGLSAIGAIALIQAAGTLIYLRRTDFKALLGP
jgi:zinc-ribbon domain